MRHLENLAKLGKEGIFMYGGRGDEPNSLFISGKCAMITGSSGLRANIAKNAKFEFGTSTLPYYSDVQGAPQNTIIGGASLWVFANKKPETYKGAAFFKFLASPDRRPLAHQTGYVPVTKAAYELTKKEGFYDKNPGTEVGVKQLNVETTAQSRGLRLGLPQIREIEDAEIERIVSGKVTAGRRREHRQARQRAAGKVRKERKVTPVSRQAGILAARRRPRSRKVRSFTGLKPWSFWGFGPIVLSGTRFFRRRSSIAAFLYRFPYGKTRCIRA